MNKGLKILIIVLLAVGLTVTAVVIVSSSNKADTSQSSEQDAEQEYEDDEFEDEFHMTEVPEGYVGIYSVDDFEYIKNMENGKFILMNDIDMSDISSWDLDINLTGEFDGNNYTITNYTCPAPLFTSLVNGSIYDLNIDADISAVTEIKEFGVLVGEMRKEKGENCTVSNVCVTGNIQIDQTDHLYYNSLGGIIGKIDQSNSTGEIRVQNCIFDGNIESSTEYVGGIVGEAIVFSGEIEGCICKGNISTHYSVSCGGIVARFGKKITNCHNYANIQATGNSGGICGEAASMLDGNGYEVAKAEIYGCSNHGDIDYSFLSGGIVGDAKYVSSIEDCINYGAIHGSVIGGIIGGYLKNGSMSNCCNVGDVSNDDVAGALIGDYKSGDAIPYNCYYVDKGVNVTGIKATFPSVYKISENDWKTGNGITLSDAWEQNGNGEYTLCSDVG